MRPIVFTEPDRLVPPAAWAGHLPFAFWLVDVLRPRELVELGVHSGNSYCGFCQAVKMLDLPAACYGIDTWQGDPQAGFYGADVFADLQAWHGPRYGGFSRLVRSTFDAARDHFPDGSIDLLHIDGYHTYEAVAHDFASWQPKLSPRAVVLFHDTNVREGDFGVWRFWGEVCAGRPHFTFLHSHGLGVLATGTVDAAPLDWLFSAAGHEAASIRAVLARLGGVVEAQIAAAGLDTPPAIRLKAERDALAEQVEALTAETEALVAETVNRDRRLTAAYDDLRTAEERHQATEEHQEAARAQERQVQADAVGRLHALAAEASATRDATGRELEALREAYRAYQADSERRQAEALERVHALAAEAAAARDATGRALDELRAYQADSERRQAELEAQLIRIRASTSWRVTAPLRAVGRLIKRR